MKLSVKQEKFCNYYIECGNASEAYRSAYPNSKKWADKTVWERASVLLKNNKVLTRVKELQEELLAHYGKGTFLIPVEENGQIPILKQKDGSLYQPVFTDVLEFQKFTKGRPVRSAVVPGEKIAELLMEDVKGVVLNPLGVNVQLQVARRKRE